MNQDDLTTMREQIGDTSNVQLFELLHNGSAGELAHTAAAVILVEDMLNLSDQELRTAVVLICRIYWLYDNSEFKKTLRDFGDEESRRYHENTCPACGGDSRKPYDVALTLPSSDPRSGGVERHCHERWEDPDDISF